MPVFRWFNKHLKGEDPLIEDAAVKLFTPEQLRVFTTLPADQINTKIQENFVPVAAPNRTRDEAMRLLREKTFRGWPEATASLDIQPAFSVRRHGLWFRAFDFTSQAHVRLRLFLAQPANLKKPSHVVLEIQDEAAWQRWLAAMQTGFAHELAEASAASATPNAPVLTANQATQQFQDLIQTLKSSHSAFAWIAPRGIGPTAWSGDAKKQTQIRRRFMLLGQTLDGMRVWDIRRGIQALSEVQGRSAKPVQVQAKGAMAVNALYASLFENGIQSLDLTALPESHRDGPDYLNVLRMLDIPQVLALAKERAQVKLDSLTASSP